MSTLQIVSLVISTLALIFSAIALWKTHFVSFRPVTAVGDLSLRCYPVRYEEDRWYIMSFGVPFTVLNSGAQPGAINGARLVLEYPQASVRGGYELVPPAFDIDPAKAARISFRRKKWAGEVVVGDPMPFPVLPKATQTRYYLFETRWDAPVIQKRVVAKLELKIDTRWKVIAKWSHFRLDETMWPHLISGSSFSFSPDGSEAHVRYVYPEHLHKEISVQPPTFDKLLREREAEENRDV